MKGLTRIGNDAPGNLTEQEASEQAKTLARRLADQLRQQGLSVTYSKVLEAVSASLGETDWQVLKHKGAHTPAHSPVEAGDPNAVVTLDLGIATHYHKHGEDVFLFQEVPSMDTAMEAVNSESWFEPNSEESIDVGSIQVTVDAAWLARELARELAPRVKASPAMKRKP